MPTDPTAEADRKSAAQRGMGVDDPLAENGVPVGHSVGEDALVRPLAHLTGRGGRVGAVAGWVAGSFLVAGLLRFNRISGRDRTLVLAGQAFTAVIPLMILVAAFGPDDQALPRRVIDRFGLSGTAAEAVTTLFSRPPDSTGAFTALGVVLLFFSLLSFAKSLQRTYEAAWELPSRGWRGTVDGLGGVALMLIQIAALAVLGHFVRKLPAGDQVSFVLSAGIAVLLWLQLQRLLLSRRVQRRQLLPGALAAGVGQAAVAVYSTLWMPHLVQVNAQRYGVIGVTFALLTWLIVISAGVVVAAVVSAEAGARQAARHPGAADASPGAGARAR